MVDLDQPGHNLRWDDGSRSYNDQVGHDVEPGGQEGYSTSTPGWRYRERKTVYVRTGFMAGKRITRTDIGLHWREKQKPAQLD